MATPQEKIFNTSAVNLNYLGHGSPSTAPLVMRHGGALALAGVSLFHSEPGTTIAHLCPGITRWCADIATRPELLRAAREQPLLPSPAQSRVA